MALSARAFEVENSITSAEFEFLPEFDQRYELLDGRLVKKDVPGFEHGLIADKIKKALWLFDLQGELGLMLTEVNTILGPKDSPLPDLSFWTAANRPAPTKGAAPKPDLAIEVLSPRDLKSKKRRAEVQDKIKRYQSAKVALVWVINPDKQIVEVYRPDQPDPVVILTKDDQLDGEEVIPGFTMPVKALF